jgi:rhodanese-related sulfurtransferase
MSLKAFFFQLGVIVGLSVFIGVSANLSLVKQYLNGDFSQSFFSPKDFPSIQFIGLTEAEDLFMRGDALFLDSRAEEKFLEGHILDAINIPFEEGERAVHEQLSFPRDGTLVVYCDGNECQSSILLAKVLADQGFEDIRVFFGGWAEWVVAGLPSSEKNDQS